MVKSKNIVLYSHLSPGFEKIGGAIYLQTVKYLKSVKGFTLVEMIISIAILALASGMILQLFISSKNLNQKAMNLDKAAANSQSLVELFQSGHSAGEFLNNPSLNNAFTKTSKTEVNIKLFYDENWIEIKSSIWKTPDHGNKIAAFILDSKIVRSSENYIQNNTDTGLYQIAISCTKQSAYALEKKKESKFYDISATKYFNYK